MIDVLFIAPGSAEAVYQNLASKYAAIEPPTWALLLAESCRSQGFSVELLDVAASNYIWEEVVDRVNELCPRLICFVVYGQNVNSGITSMTGAVSLSSYIKLRCPLTPISFVGSYIQALPVKTLEKEPSIDFGFTNEGVYTLWEVLALEEINELSLRDVKGVVYREEGAVVVNPAQRVVPNERMDLDLPGYAWDLLPYAEKPLDLYRSPLWHARYKEENRTPYAAIQTSLGCQFSCEFCMINIINRNDSEEIGVAGNYSGMRFWSPEFIIKEFDKLVELGVRTIKITDEMFLFNRKHYTKLCNLLVSRDYIPRLNLWAYSRIDTIRYPETLKTLKAAGINWLAIGIESANKKVRLEVSKGKFEDVDIRKVIKQVHDSGIDVIGNYIFGLPGDTLESMQETLDLSKELCTLAWNAYPAMALPGSQLYKTALERNIRLPESYAGYSFHGYKTVPFVTEELSAADILKFRDEAYNQYHLDPKFLEKVREKFGQEEVNNIIKMCELKLKRRIIEEDVNQRESY